MKAVNGDHVPEHTCAAGPADPSCCATCGEKLSPWHVFMIYGSFDVPRPNNKPLNFVVVRVPEKGVPWRKIHAAVHRLVKTFYPAGTRRADRYCNLDGDITWENGIKIGAALYTWADGNFRLVPAPDTERDVEAMREDDQLRKEGVWG